MLEDKVLVLEPVAVDRLASCSVASCEVSSLDHEVGDDSVEGTSGEFSGSIVAFAESDEVFNGFRDDSSEEVKDNIACGLLSNFDGDGDSVGGGLLSEAACTSLSAQNTAAESRMRIANLFMLNNDTRQDVIK